MNFDPALDGLLDLLAEAVVRELEKQNPTTPAGFCTNVPLADEDWNNHDTILQDTGSPQAASS